MRSLKKHLVLASLLVACSAVEAQEAKPDLAAQLFQQERWEEVVRFAHATANHSPELEYEYGVSLARLERWNESRTALLSGARLAPGDKRFMIELAGVAFKQKDYPAAIAYLHRALHLDPNDAYANDFLATLYYLEGNLETAVKFWNHVDETKSKPQVVKAQVVKPQVVKAQIVKPEIGELRSEPALRLRPSLLDHAFAFAPESTLRLDDLRATEANLKSLEVLPVSRLELAARPDGKFDTVLHAQEISGFGATKLEALLRTFRGIAFQEVTPEYYNLNHAAINILALERWDPDKRRTLVSVSGPFGFTSSADPRGRYKLTLDDRNENWDIRDGFTGPAPLLASLNMRREAITAEISRLIGWRWKWTAGAEVSRRDYRNVRSLTTIPAELLISGLQVKQTVGVRYEFLRSPERRLTASASAGSQAGRVWSEPAHAFDKLQAAIDVHWLPRAKGDDYETRWLVRANRTFGQLPFDELFILGLDRDNDRDNNPRMRAHIGTRDGRKGSAPLGRNYFVANWETDKNLYSNGLLALKLGPFIDTGTIRDPSPLLGSEKWLCDTGAQLKLRVLGVGVAFSYGKDLRTGNNAFFTTVMR